MKLFEAYVKEKDGLEFLGNDAAFLTYSVRPHDQFYIADFFLKNPLAFRSLMLSAYEIAEKNGCTRVTCHVPFNVLHLTEVVMLRLKFGFKLLPGLDEGRLAFQMAIEDLEKWVKQ